MSPKIKKTAEKVFIGFCCICLAVFSIANFTYSANEKTNRLIKSLLPLCFGSPLAVWMMVRENSGLFKKPEKWLFLAPCLLVAVNNFPFCSFFAKKCGFVSAGTIVWLLFIVYCLLVGLFEECVFRGIVFPALAGRFSQDKKGVIKTFFLSSVVFGASHLLNLLTGGGVGATLLQVVYSTLIGGLCAFVLMKTKNILLCALVHSTYDICGLALDQTWGCGNGVVFDFPTAFMMAIVGVAVGVFVLYQVFTYSEEERSSLYQRLGFGVKTGDFNA